MSESSAGGPRSGVRHPHRRCPAGTRSCWRRSPSTSPPATGGPCRRPSPSCWRRSGGRAGDPRPAARGGLRDEGDRPTVGRPAAAVPGRSGLLPASSCGRSRRPGRIPRLCNAPLQNCRGAVRSHSWRSWRHLNCGNGTRWPLWMVAGAVTSSPFRSTVGCTSRPAGRSATSSVSCPGPTPISPNRPPAIRTDFLSTTGTRRERDLERGLVEHLREFLLELGQGFAFIG